jgi:dihydroflavonol-4-reductase
VRVLVTGGTGYVGSHVVAALHDAGHDVRVLARRPAAVAGALEPLRTGLTLDVEVAHGDVLDADAVDRAVRGCDALINAANVYSLDQRDAARMRQVNVDGTRTVLQAAADAGLDPLVHVSSYVALLPSKRISTASPTGDARTPYPESKAGSERVALDLAADGAPVVLTNPGTVYGPHDPNMGESATSLCRRLRNTAPVAVPATFPVVDVRDLAQAHARIVDARDRWPRYLLAGRLVDDATLDAELCALTGRRRPRLPVGERAFRALARIGDVAQRLGVDPGVSTMSTFIAADGLEAVDDADAQAALGVTWRPVRETLADMTRWLVAAGHLHPKHAGPLLEPTASSADPVPGGTATPG